MVTKSSILGLIAALAIILIVVLMTGDAYERKFSQKGTFDYYCMLHTWMTGQIIVE